MPVWSRIQTKPGSALSLVITTVSLFWHSVPIVFTYPTMAVWLVKLLPVVTYPMMGEALATHLALLEAVSEGWFSFCEASRVLMQSGVRENGTRVKSSVAGHSVVMSVSGSEEDHFEEKPKFNGAVERGYRVGGAGEVINQSVMAPAVAAVQVLQPQAGFWQRGTSFGNGSSELTPILPRFNSSCSQPIGSPSHLHCFPYKNMCVSSAAAQNLKRKVEVSGSSYYPAHVESFFSRMPSAFCQDSVFMPVQAVFQNRFFPASGSQICDPSGGDTSAAIHKRKVVRPRCSSSLNATAASNGTQNDNSEPSHKLKLPAFREHYSLGTIPCQRESFTLTCSELQPGYLPSACVYKPEDDKVIEEKGWTALVQKELRNTDVGNLGRIVLPKRDAEANLPTLVAKDGLFLQMEDMTYSVNWKFKYRYWPNNRSRMYVMENTGDFVRMHNLRTGDFFIVYKEESSGKYIARGKKGIRSLYAREVVEPGNQGRTKNRDTKANSQVGLAHGASSVPTGGYEVTRADTFMANESFEKDTDGPSGSAVTPLPGLHRDEIP
ncbi:hypothetical protein NE237_005760 [Protea cynaroides]|uniref:TF-B3 domain-containing protein n=1 Tax=Protea cynaroides TaxID=273540 RepID=A0A9Q0KLU4_9MAGN|nr:hypothetical protein NE237_005760 [Protea cynaroides]